MAKGNIIQVMVEPIRTLDQLEELVRKLRERAGPGDRYINVSMTWGGRLRGAIIDMDGYSVGGSPTVTEEEAFPGQFKPVVVEDIDD